MLPALVGLLLLALPLSAARRAGLAAATCLGVAGLAWAAPTAWVTLPLTWAAAGRALSLTPSNTGLLLWVAIQAAVVLAVSPLLGASNRLAGLALIALSGLMTAIMIEPVLYSALFWALAAIMSLLLTDAPSDRRAVGQYLAFTLMVAPLFLTANWQLGLSTTNPGQVEHLLYATLALGTGFLVMVAAAPFHAWQLTLSASSSPAPVVWLTTVLPTVALGLLVSTLDAFIWLRTPLVASALRVSGLATLILGSVVFLGRPDTRRAYGAALLVDLGAILIALGADVPGAVALAWWVAGTRTLGSLLWGLGVHGLLTLAPTGADGHGRRAPVVSAAVLLGPLTVAGFPLLAGFPARWLLAIGLAASDLWSALAIGLGMAAALVAALRNLVILLGPDPDSIPISVQERVPTLLAIGALLGLILVVGAFPQLWFDTALAVIAPYSRLR
jgi:formate hydrogenlyase subunit 3/multisubunit Na+/H+ antiporter MnhD subunit